MKKLCLIFACLSILVFAPKQQVAFAQYDADFEIFGLTCTPANPVVGEEVVLSFFITNNLCLWPEVDSLVRIDTEIEFTVNGVHIENFMCATFCPNQVCSHYDDDCGNYDHLCVDAVYPPYQYYYDLVGECKHLFVQPPYCFCQYYIEVHRPYVTEEEIWVGFRIDPSDLFPEENEGDNYVEMHIIVSEADIPTLTEWGLIIFGLVLLAFITWVFLRRRKAISLRV